MLSSNLSVNQSKRFFTPIVASSLALFLGAGIANAAALSCPTLGPSGSSSMPQICYEFGGSPLTNSSVYLNWILLGPEFVYQPSTVTFRFDGSGVPKQSFNPPFVIGFGYGGKSHSLVLDGGTNGIEIRDGNGRGLVVFFGEAIAANRQFHLNLSQSRGEFSFRGEIKIEAGYWDSASILRGDSKFVGDFGKKVVGNIIILHPMLSRADSSWHKTELNFGSGADLQGGISTQAGTTIATFADGNIIGSVNARGATNGYQVLSRATNIITFKGRDNKITLDNISGVDGGVVAYVGGANTITAATGTLTIGSQGGGGVGLSELRAKMPLIPFPHRI